MKRDLFVLSIVFCAFACVEPFPLEEEDTFENALVVEALLTDELKRHTVLLTRSANLSDVNRNDSVPYNPFLPIRPSEDNTVYETNAEVSVSDNQGNVYVFLETDPGRYISEIEFAAQIGVEYTLRVLTSDGTSYVSKNEELVAESEITDVYAVRERNDQGEEGISIYLDSEDASGEPNFFRYDYEETYKIIAPNWTQRDFELSDYDPCALPVITYNLEIVEREEEEMVCYNTVKSDRIIQNSSEGSSGSSVKAFPIRFISADDFILSHRYSILVRQYVQTLEAYSYYRALRSFSSTESVFFESQPGFIESNINAENNPEIRVLGYFEVVTVASKRIFFDYTDFFPEEPLPPYPFNCVPSSAQLDHPSYCFDGLSSNNCPQSIVERVNLDLISYVGDNSQGLGTCPGPYVFVPRICGDCTILGSNQVPDFWVQ